MKFIKNIKTVKKAIYLLSASALLISCSDYLDVNTDTDNPADASLDFLLSNISKEVANVGDFNTNSGQILAVYTHQMTNVEDESYYNVKADNLRVQNDWNTIYQTITNLNDLINRSKASNNLIYTGIGQMHKAYLMSVAVDLWGDVPYTDANKLTEGIKNPKFDNQKAIYAAIFELMNEAKANIVSNKGILKPKNDDLFYTGDTSKWLKFINTFKLKLYNQVKNTSLFNQTDFETLINEDNFFTSYRDDFEFAHYNNNTKSNERNNLFIAAYESTQFGSFQSPWLYEIMKGLNPKIFTYNIDPRLNYYFFNQLKADDFPNGGNQNSGNPQADYWDASTGFLTLRFGSNGPFVNVISEPDYTYPGIYLCGGRYDDQDYYVDSNGFVKTVDVFAGTGQAPRRILTYDEFLFIKAELIHSGKLAGDASDVLSQAIDANFKKIDIVARNAKLASQSVPRLATSQGASDYLESILAEYEKATNNGKLEIIMTQKWIATAGDPLDQYADYRRTGYPVLADPNSSSKEYELDNNNGFPINDSQTNVNNRYPNSFYWPQSELNANSNAPAQKEPSNYKIFWDIN